MFCNCVLNTQNISLVLQGCNQMLRKETENLFILANKTGNERRKTEHLQSFTIAK